MFGLEAVVPLFFSSIGLSINEWGILAAFFGLGMLILEATWGLLSDKFGRIIFMVGGLFLSALILPLYTFNLAFPLYVLLQFLRGGLSVMVAPTGRSLVSDLVSPRRLGMAMGLLGASISLGVSVGSLIFGYATEIMGYHASFYLCTAILLTAGLLSVVGFRSTGQSSKDAKYSGWAKTLSVQTLLHNISNPAAMIILSCTVLSFLQFALVRSFVPIYASTALSASTSLVGVTQAVFSGSSVVLYPICGAFSDKIGRKKTIVVGFLMSFLASVMCPLIKDVYQLLPLITLAAFGFSLLPPSFIVLLSKHFPKGARGAAIGLYGSFENLGIMIGPILYAFSWNLNPIFIFYFCAAAQIIGILIALMLQKLES